MVSIWWKIGAAATITVIASFITIQKLEFWNSLTLYRRSTQINILSSLSLPTSTGKTMLSTESGNINVYDIFSHGITKDDFLTLRDIVGAFLHAVNSANLTYFMYSGTLIGSYRHHSIIPWDEDLDVILPERHKEDIIAAIKKFEPTFTLNTQVKYRWKLMSPKSYHIRNNIKWKYPFMDVYFYEEDADNIWDEDPVYASSFRFKKSDVFPLIERPFWGFSMCAPRLTKKILDQTYGNVDICRSRTYIHKKEFGLGGDKAWIIPCSHLAKFFPFVTRTKTSNGINETLVNAGRVLSSVVIKDVINV